MKLPPSALECPSGHRSVGLVLCDIGLPGMSGYEVAKALRAWVRNETQFVAMTGAPTEDVKNAADAGFDQHIAKPGER